MNTEVLAAIVTAGASLLVATISLVSATISNRQARQTARAIENLKFELNEKRDASALSDEYLARRLESLRRLIQAIQQMKDVTQLIVDAPGTSLDSETAMGLALEAREHIFACYEENLADLEKEDAKHAHRAKNKAFGIQGHVQQRLQDASFTSSLSEEDREVLVRLRTELSEIQNLLRDNRISALSRRIESD